MFGAVRAFFAPKRRRADAQDDEQECKDAAKRRRAESGARAAESTTARAESGAFDGAHVEGNEECDDGVTMMLVAREGEDTSGVEPTDDDDDDDDNGAVAVAAAAAAAATTSKDEKKNKKKKKKTKKKKEKKEKKEKTKKKTKRKNEETCAVHVEASADTKPQYETEKPLAERKENLIGSDVMENDDDDEWFPEGDEMDEMMDSDDEWLPASEDVEESMQEDDDEWLSKDDDMDETRDKKDKKKKDKKKRKTSKCVLCKCAVAQRTVSKYFVGLLHTDVFGPVFNRFTRTKRKRIGTIDPNQKFCQGDGLCRACASMCGDCVRDRDEWKFESTSETARKLAVFQDYIVQKCEGKLPRNEDLATIARWNNENDEERDGVPIGSWWCKLNSPKGAERLERLKNFDDASKNALAYLATCALREDRSLQTVHDVRKLAIYHDYVVQKYKGKLPRGTDLATIARWNNENAEERDGVPIGTWWYTLNRPESAERLERLKNFDDASKNALAYLATCAPREHGNRKPGRKAK